uniref:Late endosomal/lysosomal adaptor and MAPK and MTOR activator 5 n=1 Tax=Panagrolaimus sp. ES5 TaxID=591445 RepID=A0AC34FMY7_9BILA
MQKVSPLEESFRTSAKDLMAKTDVKGVLCMDERGQPFFHDGTLSENSAAILSQLVQISATINTNADSPTPIITLMSANSKVIVARNTSIIVAVHRQRQQAHENGDINLPSENAEIEENDVGHDGDSIHS